MHSTESRLVLLDHKVTPMYVTQQGLLVVSLTEEQDMKITLSFWLARLSLRLQVSGSG